MTLWKMLFHQGTLLERLVPTLLGIVPLSFKAPTTAFSAPKSETQSLNPQVSRVARNNSILKRGNLELDQA